LTVQIINKGEKTMKRMIFFITLAFLLSVSIVLMPVEVYAQKQITVINPSFEKPDSGKIRGFDGKSLNPATDYKHIDIPGWNVDSKDSLQWDSGIEKKATSDGQYDAFLMGHDPGIYQILNRRVTDSDMLKLKVDARNSWQATAIKMELFFLDGDSAKAPRVTMVSETKTLTNTMAEFSISINASAVPLAVGHKIGILLDNVTPAPNDSASWLELDNVRLTNEDPTIVEVPNYSFEQPDLGKIEGWNGPGSSPKIATSQADIPGWTTDTIKVADSGIEPGQNLPEGTYGGFLMGSDTSVWNTTNYTIQAGDTITLKVMGRNSWQATLLRLELYYVDLQGKRTSLKHADSTLTSAWTDYSISFSAADVPACVGNKLGVMLDNVSPTGASWLNMDFVRVNVNHAVAPEAGFAASVKSINFGTIYTNATKKDSIVVTNHGALALSITAVASTNPLFTVTPTTATVAVEGSQKFYITFAPAASGTQIGKIAFTHNAWSHDTITVTGNGNSDPSFAASVKSINFGTINTNVTKKDSVIVANNGASALSITGITSTNSHFTVTPTTATVAAGGTQKFYITFAPVTNITQSGKIVFKHNAPTHDTISVTGIGNPVSVNDQNAMIPNVYKLYNNYPNPFNPSTTIQYDLPKQSIVTLKVYSLLGQEVATLVNDNQAAGYHQVVWMGQNNVGKQASSGVYIIRIFAKSDSKESETFTQVKKMILLK
jgi:hypothetical protein